MAGRPLSTFRVLALLVPGAAVIFAAGLATGETAKQSFVDEPGEQNPGGSATTRESIDTADAFSHVSHGITLEGESMFKVGNAIFRKLWVAAPSSTTSSDGLGPLYNSRSCQSCHLKDGRGHPPAANFPDDRAESMFLRLSIPPQTDEQKRLLAEHRVNSIDEPTYGEQLQNLAVTGLSNEGHMHVAYSDAPVTFGDGTIVTLRRPKYSVDGLKYGPLHPDVMMSPRVAPQMIGVGLLEAIPEADIRANADPDDADRNGISGRTNEVWSSELGKPALGRFGWKAGKPSVREQSANALAVDMGLSNPLDKRAAGDCTAAQAACLGAPNGNTVRDENLEVGTKVFDHLVFYAQNLAVPPRRNVQDPVVREGKALFYALGCQACHKPSFTTGTVEGQPHLSGQKIWPYSDLLLHDLGDGLADNRPEGAADGREWRTAPLWGIGLTRIVNGHMQLLHDGRARGIEEAILWHGGEAQAAREGYAALSKAEREALIRFVESL
jgi:CxxC motif-containing protein (DUF1111 family)